MPDDRRPTPAGARWLGNARAADDAGPDPRPGAGEDGADFVARVATALRAPERAAPDFEVRLMAAVRADATAAPTPRAVVRQPRSPRAPWWRRSLEVRVVPLAGFALAAGFAGVVCLGTLRLASPGRPGVVAASVAPLTPARDTVHVVRFVLDAPRAERVALVGDFNAWAKNATPLAPAGRPGAWTVSVAVPAGRHEYAFVVDGERWVVDPSAPAVYDEHGTESSALVVRAAPAPGA